MRILWVKVGGLWPLNTGGRLRSFHILSELSRRHRVTLLTTHGPGENPAALAAHLPPAIEVTSIPYAIPKRGTVRFALALLRSWCSSLPVDVAKFRVPVLLKKVRQVLETKQADLCVADFLSAAPNVSFGGSAPVVFFAHNVEHVIWKRLSRIDDRMWRRGLLELEWRKMRRCEARICMRSTLTLTVSEIDRQTLAAVAPGADLRAVQTGVDTVYFTPSGNEESAAHLVFTGSMDWHPNEDAILHFLDSILPRIRREIPDASLTVVGRNPTPRLLARAAETGTRVTGTVDDVRPYIREAALYVVPLRIGGGTRLKIFEALAMGKAVMSTTIGAEGLPVVPGKHIILADDPVDFAHAAVSLLKDPARRKALGHAGRQLVEARYSWCQVADEFEARCREAVNALAGMRTGATTSSKTPRRLKRLMGVQPELDP